MIAIKVSATNSTEYDVGFLRDFCFTNSLLLDGTSNAYKFKILKNLLHLRSSRICYNNSDAFPAQNKISLLQNLDARVALG